ncbi:hypothetical protein BDW59DRAFT_175290 [Aspergillus cavernicola]|uniref:Single-strand DNA deaminase toxin A-like C-terminal domain-containing protein n=1 Tax=Aspergillus cavernicola TaxID=176166 RepID=A0ABR4HRI5_9EURO
MSHHPEADVLWWNAHSYYVLYPHCEEVHRHCVNWDGPMTRVPHCGNSETYLCCFPFNTHGQAAYEIDKRHRRYVNICAPSHDDTDEVDLLARALAANARITMTDNADRGENDPDIQRDSREVITIGLKDPLGSITQKKIGVAIGDCVDGRTAELSSTMVALLLERGARVNAVNHDGRSPLMQASLWGRLENVKLLLGNGADKDIRDNDNRLAIDLAQPIRKNRCERYTRLGGEISPAGRSPPLLEDTFKRDIDRERIVRLLGGENRKSKIVHGSPPTVAQFEDYSFLPSPGSLVLQGPIERYPIDRPGKTVARLERGGKYASIGAMIDGREWTDEVVYISTVVGHPPTDHEYDQGQPGRFNACHAEKQLIVYFIDRHVFLPRDTAADEKLEAKMESVETQYEGLFLLSDAGRKLSSVRRQHQDIDTAVMDADDEWPGHVRDGIKVESLKQQREPLQAELLKMNQDPSVQQIIALESRLQDLNQQKDRHEDLVEMSNAQPPVSLTDAVILISSPICQDCVD